VDDQVFLEEASQMTEVRTLPVIGTHYKEFALYVNGECVHRQLSPYSDAEIKERVARHRKPTHVPPLKVSHFRSKSGPKPAGYVWRTGVDED
jgi:hypothetical protein